MAASAFCPAYITGIFSIGEKDAAGAGFAIDLGLATKVAPSTKGRTVITINGAETPAPVSKAVLRRFFEQGCKTGVIDVEHKADLPIGYGMGMSAAGALSFSLALNEFLGAGLSREKCVKIAHDSDVECGTGLSGVDAAAIGGALLRETLADAPVLIDFGERKIHLAFFSPIKTSEIIRDNEWKKKVNAAGSKALLALAKEKSWDALIAQSRTFALDSNLAEWCRPHLGHNPRASMAMLGHTLFSDSPLFMLGTPMKQMEAKTSNEGARII
jgi:pantoate kinase